ncbi:MAG: hypothetical protein K7J47_20530 [Acidobacteria bacterium]|nr:hypothetical protein [Bryobacteraceae bacterium CoA2 C42]
MPFPAGNGELRLGEKGGLGVCAGIGTAGAAALIAAHWLGGALADVTLAWLGRAGGVSRGRVLVLRGVTACGILAGEKMGRWGVSTGV